MDCHKCIGNEKYSVILNIKDIINFSLFIVIFRVKKAILISKNDDIKYISTLIIN
ncbi:hypothetical protein RhiirC2_799918 [Rhizophagus irregularis]|uniref:Uncharacterized protein n=1 Tax=Rhizophagus irregularis TaxID=588596 RepID=A0A2N1M4A5_9GLOM|nr:hypothetical protein RhiirC2_799918 [Rhizophagus irregularis]